MLRKKYDPELQEVYDNIDEWMENSKFTWPQDSRSIIKKTLLEHCRKGRTISSQYYPTIISCFIKNPLTTPAPIIKELEDTTLLTEDRYSQLFLPKRLSQMLNCVREKIDTALSQASKSRILGTQEKPPQKKKRQNKQPFPIFQRKYTPGLKYIPLSYRSLTTEELKNKEKEIEAKRKEIQNRKTFYDKIRESVHNTRHWEPCEIEVKRYFIDQYTKKVKEQDSLYQGIYKEIPDDILRKAILLFIDNPKLSSNTSTEVLFMQTTLDSRTQEAIKKAITTWQEDTLLEKLSQKKHETSNKRKFEQLGSESIFQPSKRQKIAINISLEPKEKKSNYSTDKTLFTIPKKYSNYVTQPSGITKKSPGN